MEIYTDLSGIQSIQGQQEARQLVKDALTKVNPQYVELFSMIDAPISIEEVICGEEDTLGMSRFPRDIAIKTSCVSKDDLNRTLTEEIIHFLDHYLNFSDKQVFQMQIAANADASHPLSLAMLTAVRSGTTGLESINDVIANSNNPTLMKEFDKSFPFLGAYRVDQNMNKYEWLTEVEHAEKTLSEIKDNDHLNILSTNAQKNMNFVLILYFLAENGIDLIVELEKIEKGLSDEKTLKQRVFSLTQDTYTSWLNTMAAKVNIEHTCITEFPDNSISPDNALLRINAGIAHTLGVNRQYPLSETALREVMITMFPESYYALQSFRDEVDRELIRAKRRLSVSEAFLKATISKESLKTYLITSNMDEVAMADLQDKLKATMPEEASAIGSTLQIYKLIKSYRTEEAEPLTQVKSLLKTAWTDILIDGKTILTSAAKKELYGIASAIRDTSKAAELNLP